MLNHLSLRITCLQQSVQAWVSAFKHVLVLWFRIICNSFTWSFGGGGPFHLPLWVNFTSLSSPMESSVTYPSSTSVWSQSIGFLTVCHCLCFASIWVKCSEGSNMWFKTVMFCRWKCVPGLQHASSSPWAVASGLSQSLACHNKNCAPVFYLPHL